MRGSEEAVPERERHTQQEIRGERAEHCLLIDLTPERNVPHDGKRRHEVEDARGAEDERTFARAGGDERVHEGGHGGHNEERAGDDERDPSGL